jgi:hypothetical protein
MTSRNYTAYDPMTGATFFPKVIDGFQYPKRYCPFCEHQCNVVNALHRLDHPEIFKAIFMCENPKCEAYDLEVKKCYVRVYYSSEEALQAFEAVFLRFERLEKS